MYSNFLQKFPVKSVLTSLSERIPTTSVSKVGKVSYFRLQSAGARNWIFTYLLALLLPLLLPLLALKTWHLETPGSKTSITELYKFLKNSSQTPLPTPLPTPYKLLAISLTSSFTCCEAWYRTVVRLCLLHLCTATRFSTVIEKMYFKVERYYYTMCAETQIVEIFTTTFDIHSIKSVMCARRVWCVLAHIQLDKQ
jgi:hypothetical protein